MIDCGAYRAEIDYISELDKSFDEKLIDLKRVLERLTKDVTKEETLQFANLFSRLVFIAQKLDISKRLEWNLQNLRVRAKNIRRGDGEPVEKEEWNKHKQSLLRLIWAIEGGSEAEKEDDIAPITLKSETIDALSHMRVQIIEIDEEAKVLTCLVESEPGKTVDVRYGVTPYNDDLSSSIEKFWVGAQINIADIKEDENGNLIPKTIVLEPDYLIDASAVAECFHDFCTTPMHFFRNKFEAIENRSYILMGNLANFFLDELTFADDHEAVSFNDTFLESFKQSPFEYTSCDDISDGAGFRKFWDDARSQFENIKRVLIDDFTEFGVDLQNCTLEPSFYSEKYGFQGRLDLLHNDGKKFKIIELKSGRLPYPIYDMGKIADNHWAQTAVYRMMIESVFDAAPRNIEAAILYSSGNQLGTNLRFAADYQVLNKKIINMRNHIVANEHALINGDNDMVEVMFEKLYETTSFSKPSAKFYNQKIDAFRAVLKQCSPTELAYFYRYIRFISRELYLQKIGDVMHESPTGVAALWNSDFFVRAEALDVLFDLSINSIDISSKDMVVVFDRNNEDNEIANFREGEICIVYPRNDINDTVLNKQILKGTISSIDKHKIVVRFRHKQRNHNYFDQNKYWAIEHDTLDTGNNMMYKGLFSFLHSSKQKRNILLGLDEPKSTFDEANQAEYPENIIQKAIAAEDYFLIVGPPGTGKTSIFARRLIEEFYKNPNTNIMIMAYTNRAVDELCDSINAAFGIEEGCSTNFIRIGSELSCDERYRGQLLQNIAGKASSRDELRQTIESTRIFVSTVASINGKKELFNLKRFDVAIIDEASQILEPQIIGLLPQFDKFIMIGDHNQLPAIVLQSNTNSIIREKELTDIGISNCADSLFERLMRTAIKNNWSQCHSQLIVQGRMHNEIAAFPSSYFYPSRLLPANQWQSEKWSTSFESEENLISTVVSSNRLALFSTELMNHNNASHKTNENEADVVIAIIKSLEEVYYHDKREFDAKRVGIIAPYRNQIALIKHKLQNANIQGWENIMVDTVERFQGSQRDIIIISFCINKPYQLNFLSNLNESGKVDRKLNVTLTRARQQMFIVGNAKILNRNPIYATLLEFIKDSVIKLLHIPTIK